ncbi:MAG: hypothetical protein KGI50_06865 [Patescibacteria group bacterium]|nr:hypothetical protein [Patescibacteria group bacterium]
MKFLTYLGDVVDLDDIANIPIKLEAIVHTMVKTCRFNGATRWHYSNLQHCFNVSCICKEQELKLACLLHDVHEHLIGDIITPVSRHFPEWKVQMDSLKHSIDVRIAAFFGCPELVDPAVGKIIKSYDTEMTSIEAYTLLRNPEKVFAPPTIRDYEIIKVKNTVMRRKFKERLRRLI